MPLRTYSTGMGVPLARGVVTSIDPEILLLDEGIGAVDCDFLRKALSRLHQVPAQGALAATPDGAALRDSGVRQPFQRVPGTAMHDRDLDRPRRDQNDRRCGIRGPRLRRGPRRALRRHDPPGRAAMRQSRQRAATTTPPQSPFPHSRRNVGARRGGRCAERVTNPILCWLPKGHSDIGGRSDHAAARKILSAVHRDPGQALAALDSINHGAWPRTGGCARP
jgi:hypothetical protein